MIEIKLNSLLMKNRFLILVIGESIGYECLKNFIKNRLIKISNVISTDPKYDLSVKKLCRSNNIIFHTSSQFKKNQKIIKFNKKKNRYLLISIFSNLILKSDFLKNFNNKAFNLHPGLLPQYPGKNCVSGALFNNEKFTGVSLHLMTKKIDRGLIIKKKKIKIKTKDNLLTLMGKLKIIGVELILKFEKDLYLKKSFRLLKNNSNLEKKFPKKIPNNGLLNSRTKFSEFKKLYNASYVGQYESSWGRCCFIYKKKKKSVINIDQEYLKNKSIPKNFVTKVSKNKYILRFKKKAVAVFTQ